MSKKGYCIKQKLVLSFLLTTFLSSISGLVGLGFLYKTNKQYDYVLNNYGFAQGTLGEVSASATNIKSLMRNLIFANTESELNSAKDELNAELENLDNLLPVAEKYILTNKEKDLYSKATDNLDAYKGYRDRVTPLALENKDEEALAILLESSPTINGARENLEQIISIKKEEANLQAQSLQRLNKISILVIIALFIVTLLIDIYIIRYLNKIISSPIAEITHASKEIEAGNLNLSINVFSRDEIGELSRALNNIINYFSNILNEIKNSSTQVAAGSSQVASSAQVLAEGAAEQASAISELSASLNEINAKIQSTSQSASKANDYTANLLSHIQDSNDKMFDMLNSMNEIENSSKDIRSIIESIDSIADQTNLLALNAAIEAARAGDAGKGFAVVAEQVRDLAKQSASAAKSTSRLIEQAIKSVDNGKNSTNATDAKLKEVLEIAKQTSKLIENITENSNEQAQSVKQIYGGIEEILDVVHSVSATSEESASASEELTAQATSLNEMLSKFKLKNSSL